VAERVDWKGAVLVPLDEVDARRQIRSLRGHGAESFAVCLLWSFKNPVHERRLGALLGEMVQGAHVSVSTDLSPLIGEYERSATTVLNAYVAPRVEGYLRALRRDLEARGLPIAPLILQSHGGAAYPEEVIPIQTAESGPAAGIVGAKFLGDLLGLRDVIATDVGGTTFKVGLIRDGEWFYARETVLGQFEIQIPMVDVVSIGAGGGSVAWADGTRLRVGPRSAGAQPGPACYAGGGEEPTVTDADLALGILNPDYFLGGRIRLRRELAEAAIRGAIAEPLYGGELLSAADGIRRVTDAQMADLIRKVTVERGVDPRGFVLMAYGGAGPTHALAYADEVGIGRVVVPYAATVHSALAAAVAEVRHSRRLSAPVRLPAEPGPVQEIFARLEGESLSMLGRQGIPPAQVTLARWAEMRYRRQMHVIRVPVAGGPVDPGALEQLGESFEALYARLYGEAAAYREAGVECVTFGVDATAKTVQPELARLTLAGPDASPALKGAREVFLSRAAGFARTPLYDGERLRPGNRLAGGAIVEYPGTTLLILPGWTAEVDSFRNVHLTQESR
jgi:N-methylhydantoinase A